MTTLGITDTYLGAPTHKGRDDGKAWRIAHIVGIGLKRNTQNSDCFTVKGPVALIEQLVDHTTFCFFIYFDYRFCDLHWDGMFLTNACQSFGIFGKTAPPITWTSMQEFAADAIVHSNAFCDLFYVCANFFAKCGHFINKGDFGSKKRICPVFNHFRTFQIGHHNRKFAQR